MKSEIDFYLIVNLLLFLFCIHRHQETHQEVTSRCETTTTFQQKKKKKKKKKKKIKNKKKKKKKRKKVNE